ncbi:MAG: Rab family GTPase [Candidatus Hodarchaeota archaeon]
MINLETIPATIYIDLEDNGKPQSLFWYPFNLPERVRNIIEIKTKSIISGDNTFIPEVLLIFPIFELKIKILIKYFEKALTAQKQNSSKAAIIFIFQEHDDFLFYRYLSYIDSYFEKRIKRIIKLQNLNSENRVIFDEVINLHNDIQTTIKYLRSKSKYIPQLETTPETKIELEKPVRYKYKIVVLGDPSVGKTSTILRFTDNIFLRAYVPTMGLNITQKRFYINEIPMELVLWDIGGQTKFETIRRQFYEGANAFILVFDISSPKSFANVSNWYNDINNYFSEKIKIKGYLAGNKVDLVSKRIVSQLDGIRLARALNLEYFEISALTGEKIKEFFNQVSKVLIDKELEKHTTEKKHNFFFDDQNLS